MNQPHKNLEVWKKGIEIVKLIYQVTEKFPKAEKFGLIAQMGRVAVSIPSNIAEGSARQTSKEFTQFLHNAQGSLSELDTQTIIVYELDFIKNEDRELLEKELTHENKMLTGLMKSLRNRNKE
ncbi:MAG: four helix bundle protein [Syntrophaceae bacterium]